jgi:hypothetical protein
MNMVKLIEVDAGEAVALHPTRSYTILYTSPYMSDPFTFQGKEP